MSKERPENSPAPNLPLAEASLEFTRQLYPDPTLDEASSAALRVASAVEQIGLVSAKGHGIHTIAFDDKSTVELSASVFKEPRAPAFPGISRDYAFDMMLRTEGEAHSPVWVRYTIERGQPFMLFENMGNLTAVAAGVDAIAEKLKAMETSDENVDLGKLALEAELIIDGVDPSADPDIEKTREESDAQRLLSDEMRNEFANQELERQLGVKVPDRKVGYEEAEKLITLFQSIRLDSAGSN